MATVFGDEGQALTEFFLVYLDGQYYGVTDLRAFFENDLRFLKQFK